MHTQLRVMVRDKYFEANTNIISYGMATPRLKSLHQEVLPECFIVVSKAFEQALQPCGTKAVHRHQHKRYYFRRGGLPLLLNIKNV